MNTNNVNDPKTWPIGTPVQFDSRWNTFAGETMRHFAIGIVVGNFKETIVVMWPEHCAEKLCSYPIASLNRSSISRPW